MPKFRFEFHGLAKTDKLNADCPSIEAAHAQALQQAREALLDGAIEGGDQTRPVIKVYDEAGYLVATVNFADLINSKPEAESEQAVPKEPGVMRSG